MNEKQPTNPFSAAARQIARADHFLILAGAGMGVDSGLPDFRGNQGFWKAYPPFKARGLSFYDLANPVWFDKDPAQAWGFYGHRLNMYRSTKPHAGFEILLRWAKSKKSHFVFTSNVDGHFQASGFDPERIVECHGSFHFLQCQRPCSNRLWSSDKFHPNINPDSFLAGDPLPECPNCTAVARPNILMFGDSNWISDHCDNQRRRYQTWSERIDRGESLTVIEIGAGTAVPTVRRESENCMSQTESALIRINPRESSGPTGTISIDLGGLEGLAKIDQNFTGEANTNQ